VSGFFRQSLERRIVGVRYYQDMGAAAYDTLSRLCKLPGVVGDLARVFAELADEFVGCSEALAQIREGMRGKSDQDIIALYERWLSTGDQHAAARLRELGIEPAALAQVFGAARTTVRAEAHPGAPPGHLPLADAPDIRSSSCPRGRGPRARTRSPPSRGWVLVREVEDGVDIGVYIDATHLEDSRPPRRRHGHSTRAFARSAWPPKA
jgi:hypothetical protein